MGTYTAEVLRLVNAERLSAGLSALRTTPALNAVAQVRAKEASTSFSHTRPDGTSCFTALKEGGVSYRAAGENIAKGSPTPARVMEGWMNSAGHKANILNGNFTTIGIGYYVDNTGTATWSQMFIG